MKSILFFLAMVVLILQNHIAAIGIREGIALCLKAVIPALFPFLILTPMLNQSIPQFFYKLLMPLGKICGIPRGGESIFLLGLLSGYPNGARLIVQAWKSKQINKHTAQRMLGFCNNAGPAFLFGICSNLLPIHAIWILWAIHVLSAISTAILLPNKSRETISTQVNKIDLSDSIWAAAKTMVSICAWILVFRVILSFIQAWSRSYIPEALNSIIGGLLEITNGILLLDQYPQLGLRFILIASFLSWGGLCVAAQTVSITKGLGIGYYFPGKIIQTCLSFLSAYILQNLLFDKTQQYHLPLYIPALFLFIMIAILIIPKITVAFQSKVMYNACINQK